MYKLFSLLTISLLLFSCNNPNKQSSQNQNPTTKEKPDISKFNYAVVWDWTTKDKELVIENASTFTLELLNLWENNDIENVYFDSEAEVKNDMQFPSISFFVKSQSITGAKIILNDLTIVKKGIASYKLYPVGMLWLKQTLDSTKINMNDKSFVTIWKTKNKETIDDLTKTQSDTILSLWNNGKIENVYFDVQGVMDKNKTTDFVFYIRAANMNEAEIIAKSLPFYKENIATYQIFPAGVFWLGINK